MDNYSELAEEELVELLKKSDQQAFSTLYFQHVQKLKYFIQRSAQSPQLSEDIVQDTFIKIWESRGSIDPTKPFRPFLYTVAKRTLLNVLKRAQHETVIMTEIRKYATVTENTTSLNIEYNESNGLVVEAVNALSGQPKEVFMRCRVQGLTYKQAADELGITESTVNKHMNRALTLIREYIRYKNALALLLAYIAVHK